MPNLKATIQSPNQGRRVTLYQLDLRLYGEGIRYLVTGDEGDTVRAVSFGGQIYSPWAIDSTGWEVTSSGKQPRPRLTLANVSGILTALIENNNDLEGAKVRRILTRERHLDSGSEPDPLQTKPIDEYIINKKLTWIPNESVTFELTSLSDQQGTYLPGRQANRDYCPFVYRIFDPATGNFDHDPEIVNCPYTETTNGNLMFDENDNPVTDGAQDVCGKRLGSCKLRHGSLALPFGGFPGLSRVKV